MVKAKPGKSVLPHVKPGPVRPQRRGSVDLDLKVSRRTENFTLTDYTPQKLAEQLTLIEQVLSPLVFRLKNCMAHLNFRVKHKISNTGLDRCLFLNGIKFYEAK